MLGKVGEVLYERQPHQARVLLVEQHRMSTIAHRNDIRDTSGYPTHGQLPIADQPALAQLRSADVRSKPAG